MNFFLALLSVMVLSSCGIKEMANEARENLRKTGNAVHLQVLTTSLQQMLSPVNTESLTPPVRMFPFGDTFGKEATPMEILEVYHTFLMDVKLGGSTNKSHPTSRDLRLAGRKISLAAAGVISSFTPQDKFESILNSQIELGGRYEDTVYIICLTRYTFLRDFFLSSIIEKSDRVNLDSVKKAAEYFSQLKYIANLSYIDRIVLHIPQFVVVEPAETELEPKEVLEDLDISINPQEYKLIARKAIRRFERDEKLRDLLHNTAAGQALLNVFQ